MCSAPGKRASSFRIEDILKTRHAKRDRSAARTPERRQNVVLCDKAKTTGKSCDVTNDEPILRRTLASNYNTLQETKLAEEKLSLDLSQLISNENVRKSFDLMDLSRKMLGNCERMSAFSGVDRFGVFGRPLGGCQGTYGSGRMPFLTSSPYYDSYSAAYDAAQSANQWSLLPPSLYPSAPFSHQHPLPPAYLRHFHSALPLAFTKRKGGQVRFTPQQTQNLERRFGSHKYLSPEDRRILAGQLKLSDRQVKTWFQNRRAKYRRANNLTTPENGDPDSDNASDEDHSSESTTRNNMFTSPRNSPISVG